jgi:hypothetical protein
MIHYILKNPDGAVFQRGVCATAADVPKLTGKTAEIVDATDPRKPPPPPPPDYRAYRNMAYPPIGDQLDAIWKLIDEMGLATGDVAAMLARVKAVKAKHPKE